MVRGNKGLALVEVEGLLGWMRELGMCNNYYFHKLWRGPRNPLSGARGAPVRACVCGALDACVWCGVCGAVALARTSRTRRGMVPAYQVPLVHS